MKVDFLINKMSGGGAERVVSLISNYLAAQGYQIRIITFTGDDSYELHPNIKRIRLHKHPLFHSVVFNGFFSLLKFYSKKSNRPDVMSSHIALLSYSTIPISRLFKIKLVVTEHINHSYSNTFTKKILREKIYSLANAVTVLTKYDLPYYTKYLRNVHLLPNPVTFTTVSKNEILARKRNKPKVLLAIGDLNRYHHKGFDNLLKIAKTVLENRDDWILKIIGGGEVGLKKLNEDVEKLKIKDKILFSGFRSDIKNQLATCDIFILPSRFEGLPMTLLEAMSQGVCCLSFDCVSGPSDIIDHQTNGWLVENQNLEELTKALNYLMDNESIRQHLALEAPTAMNKFSMHTIGKKWIELFDNL